ncbi:DUF2061 domain-containing protein [Marinospirillum perlucidum]|uniref:DUF2061 domain-containing protein n=1 Tax=Marinospirillum perlucidum TaxID=1982602 RepID=UPI001C49B4CF|nr:DUF2061 domain-containing protein [Marinospirillum perlucidum]
MLKTLTFAITHFTVAFSVVWMMTGSFLTSSLVALVEPGINTLAYFFHERIWEGVKKRKAQEAVTKEAWVA